jgi:hypothetical protein
MPSIAEFASKRTRKTKNCQKGYGCGNACINKQRKCKKKFGDQASTYAGWLKKNAAAGKDDDKAKKQQVQAERGVSRQAKIDKFLDDLIENNDPAKGKTSESMLELRSRKKELGFNSQDIASKLREKILNQSIDYQDLGRDGKNTYDDNKKDLLTPGLIASSKEEIKDRIDYLLSDRRILNESSRGIDSINGYRAFLKDYDDILQNDPNTQRPGESIQDFFKRRAEDPEVQKRQLERAQEDFKNRLGRLPDPKIGTIGTSGLGGKRRRKKRT